MPDTHRLATDFTKLYGCPPRLFWAPGRVNLIGEHTDYNDGFVLPIAIDLGTIVAASVRADRRFRVCSLDLGESAEFDLDAAGACRRGHWLDYVEGVARSLEDRGLRLRGADMMIRSTVPLGAGLSSSAALEIAVATGLTALSGADTDRTSLALAAQQSEHKYVGINCGIMDQYVAVWGKSNHALLLDCRSLESTLVPAQLPDIAIVVCDSRVKHALASSEYNKRRQECNLAVELLRAALPGISALRDVSVDQFNECQALLPQPVLRRARHVITENARTTAAATALRAGDLARMGSLMFQSHASLATDYEVSCRELDLLVEIAARIPGVLGARMTGGGFGGCTVTLVSRSALPEFKQRIAEEYADGLRRAGAAAAESGSSAGAGPVLSPEIYEVTPGDGAREITGAA